MKTLVIHPKDSSTDFLKPIYQSIENKTIITGGISKSDLMELIKSHDRIICLGHGTLSGLMSVGEFYTTDFHIIDESMVEILKDKTDNIYIWCHAKQFVDRHGLDGFYSGMFISEVEEALYYGINVDRNVIQESNDRFSSIVGKYINEPFEVLFDHLICDYGILARTNPIARYNLQYLFLKIKKSFVELDVRVSNN